jgi:hypothetical protein
MRAARHPPAKHAGRHVEQYNELAGEHNQFVNTNNAIRAAIVSPSLTAPSLESSTCHRALHWGASHYLTMICILEGGAGGPGVSVPLKDTGTI